MILFGIGYNFESFLKNTFGKFQKKFSLEKIKLIRIFFLAVFLIVAAFCVEYFGLGAKLHHLEKSNSGFFEISKINIVTDNFNLDENGNFVSNAPGAFLEIQIDSRYINNFEVSLEGNPNYPVFLSYIDPKTHQEIVLEKGVQNSLRKNKLKFLDQLVFPVQNAPEKIKVNAPETETIISK